jgi:hypothetical protein
MINTILLAHDRIGFRRDIKIKKNMDKYNKNLSIKTRIPLDLLKPLLKKQPDHTHRHHNHQLKPKVRIPALHRGFIQLLS